MFPMSLDVFINETALLNCWLDSQTSTEITWTKLGGALLNDIAVKDDVLRINSVQRSHVGTYICTAHTGFGILQAICRLQLKGIYLIFRLIKEYNPDISTSLLL